MRNNNNKGGESRKGGGSLLAGILLGMILGLIAAGGVAWYVLKNGSASFEDKEHRPLTKTGAESAVVAAPSKPITLAVVPAPAAPVSVQSAASAPVSAVSQTPQHFEFYKVLTDKADVPAGHSAKTEPAPKHAPAVVEPPVASEKSARYIQAGSFPSLDDAEKLKAKLSLLGMDVSVLTADIPGKGTYHRVRIGPFKDSNELNAALATLKQNGVSQATVLR